MGQSDWWFILCVASLSTGFAVIFGVVDWFCVVLGTGMKQCQCPEKWSRDTGNSAENNISWRLNKGKERNAKNNP